MRHPSQSDKGTGNVSGEKKKGIREREGELVCENKEIFDRRLNEKDEHENRCTIRKGRRSREKVHPNISHIPHITEY